MGNESHWQTKEQINIAMRKLNKYQHLTVRKTVQEEANGKEN